MSGLNETAEKHIEKRNNLRKSLEEEQDKETFIKNYVEQKCTEYKHNNFTDEVPEDKQQEFQRDAELKAAAKFA